MDELVIDGKTYLSSKQAAKVTGYAKDYVGQLCREGRVEAKLVGRSWYVYEPSITKHRFEGEEQNLTTTPEEAAMEEVAPSTEVKFPWEPASYASEAAPSLTLAEETTKDLIEEHEEPEPVAVSEIEGAWQEWFKEGPQKEEVEEEVAPYVQEEPVDQPEKELPITVIRQEPAIVEDIERFVPAAPVYQPMPRRYEAPSKAGKRTSKGTGVLSALLLAIMVLSVTISLIGVGVARKITGSYQTASPVVEFFEGVSKINTNK